jgi:hypothetical protein
MSCGRLRQQNPAQNQAVRLALRRSPPMFPPAIWNVHDVTVNGPSLKLQMFIMSIVS